jgi:alkylation response protein AidB-like acyl-CoA dehydrogenase
VAVDRELPTQEAEALLDLTRQIARDELAPRAAAAEEAGTFPGEAFTLLGKSGLLGLPYPEEFGGGGQPYTVYLQVLEELACAWLTVALSVSVQMLSAYPVASYGSDRQRARFLPPLLSGEQLGAYCLSEPGSGSDAAALATRATRDGEVYRVSGTKAWITHGPIADVYDVMVRTADTGPHGISTLLVPRDTPGLEPQPAEHKMGMKASPTSQVVLTDAPVPVENRLGEEGIGFTIALSALDAGRLGIAACAVGLAQAALDAAVRYARDRHQFGRPVIDFQGVGFLLADMAAAVAAARALYLAAARRRDAGRPFTTQAAMAKLVATDTAMRVTTDAVQVFGGYGYTTEFPVERYMREAKVLQIVEGTNQIQRLVIARALARGTERPARPAVS